MKLINRHIIIILLICSFNSRGQNSTYIPKVIENLISSEWSTVYKAKDTLEMHAFKALPHLIELLAEPKKYVKLENIADLIYPGTDILYGHGWVIDYDIDFIAIRAGWVIEELTFQDFGFKENVISDKQLIEYHKQNYEEYRRKGFHDINLTGTKKTELQATIKKVQDWWGLNNLEWDRKNAIIDALNSNNINRQSHAIQFLRHGDICIEGLNIQFHESRIQPIIKRLVKSESERIAEDAQLLIDDASEPKSEILWSWWIREQCNNGM